MVFHQQFFKPSWPNNATELMVSVEFRGATTAATIRLR